MEAKHTPGKWQIEYGFIKQERKDGQKVVRIVAPHPEGGGQDIAECLECNAPLFSTAPDLLYAIEELTGAIQLSKLNIRKDFSLINAHAYALKVIRKAKGGEG